MNILFVSNDPNIFVADSAVRKRLRAYAAYFTAVHVVSPAGQGVVSETDGKLVLHPVTVGKLFRVPVLAKTARTIVHEYSIAVVSAQDPFEQGIAALYATLRTPARLHIQIHTDFLSSFFKRASFKNNVRVYTAALVLWFADGVRVVSERIQQSIRSHYGTSVPEMRVIPIAVSSTLPEVVLLPPNSFLFSFMTVSRLESEKHIEDILSAFVLVLREYPNAGLFIVGEGQEHAPLMRRVKELAIEKNVVFLGHRADARGLMCSAQAYVNASAYEGYGLSLIEAALAGVPIVTTDVGIVGEVLLPGRDVLLFPVSDSEAAAREMIRLIEQKSLCAMLSQNAQKAAQTHIEGFPDQPKLVAADIAGVAGTGTITAP